METGFETIFALSLEPGQMVANLIVALISGLAISQTYRLTSAGIDYSPTFVRAIVVLGMITALVIMVIGNNLARAFGLVGAMSIIRFRTAVKDVQDIVFIFFSLASGMAAGVGLRGVALTGTILICIVVFALQRVRYAHPSKKQFMLQLQCELPNGEPPYQAVFQQQAQQARLANMRSLGDDGSFELTFYIELKDRARTNEFIRELHRIPSISNVRLFFDDGASG